MKMPKDIQRIKDLVEQEKITRASMDESSNVFVYEAICPDCGKNLCVHISLAGHTSW